MAQSITQQQLQQALASAEANWDVKMNELAGKFQAINQGWESHATKFEQINTAWTTQEAKFSVMEESESLLRSDMSDFSSQIAELALQTRNEQTYVRNKLSEIDTFNQHMVGRTAQIESALSAMPGAGPHTGGKGRGKYDSLINPVAFVPDVFDDTKNPGHFGKWRDDMIVYLSIYYEDIEAILDAIRGHAEKITVEEFSKICNARGFNPKWTFAEVNRDIALYVTKKLDGTAVTLAKGQGNNGFEIMRVLNKRFDPVGVQTRARMVNRITSMIRTPGPAHNFKETGARMELFDKTIMEYRKRLGSEPSADIVLSTFTNLLDPDTRGKFLDKGILEDYESMRTKYDEMIGQELSQVAVPMELGLCATKPSDDGRTGNVEELRQQHMAKAMEEFEKSQTGQGSQGAVQTPVNYPDPTQQGAYANAMGAKGKGKAKGKNGDGSCNICGGKDHWARECPQNPNKGKGGKSYQPYSKGKGWKGYEGKGGKGKGKAYGLEAVSQNGWDQGWWGEEWPSQPSAPSAPWFGEFPLTESPTALCKTLVARPINMVVAHPIKTENKFSALEEEVRDKVSVVEYPTISESIPPPPPVHQAARQERQSVKRVKRKFAPMQMTGCQDDCCADAGCKGDAPEKVLDEELKVQQVKDPVYQTIEGSGTYMKQTWEKNEERRQQNEEILNGNKQVDSWKTPEWLAAQARVRRAFERYNTSPVNSMIGKVDGKVLNQASWNYKWEPLTLMVDSGASDSVMKPSVIPSAEVQPSPGSAMGLEYEVANGDMIPNLGQKSLSVVPHGSSTSRKLNVQCADVQTGLLSVAQMVDSGNMVVFDKEGSYILDKLTGNRDYFVRTGNVFHLRLWARPAVNQDTKAENSQDFHRPGK